MEEILQYGIWKNRLPFHSIACPADAVFWRLKADTAETSEMGATFRAISLLSTMAMISLIAVVIILAVPITSRRISASQMPSAVYLVSFGQYSQRFDHTGNLQRMHKCQFFHAPAQRNPERFHRTFWHICMRSVLKTSVAMGITAKRRTEVSKSAIGPLGREATSA